MNRILLVLSSAAILAVSSAGCSSDRDTSPNAAGGSGGIENHDGSGGTDVSAGGSGGTDSSEGGSGGIEASEGGSGGTDANEGGSGGEGGEGGTIPEEPGVTINVIPDCFGMCPTFILVGEGAQLTAEATDADGKYMAGVSFSWSSENEAIAMVDQTGFVTGVSTGRVRIIAEAEGTSGSLEVEVKGVGSIEINRGCDDDCPDFFVGQNLWLWADAFDDDGGSLFGVSFTWKSGDESIATVDEWGGVLGVSAGTVRITASTQGVSDSLDLEVKNSPE